ncbi:MAG: transporter substrate-binding domain-containing protein [Pseudomonadota bacterium]
MINHRRGTAVLTLIALMGCARAENYTCVSFEYPPLIQQGEDGRAQGIAVDLVSSIFARMGHTLKVELFPWGRSLAMAQQGERDCIFTLYHSAERDLVFDYSAESIAAQVVYFYAKKDSGASFDGNLAALGGLRIGTAHKINYGPKFELARSSMAIDEAPTIAQNFRKLASGRVDLVPSNLYTATFTLAQPSLAEFSDKIVKLPTPIESVPSYIAFPKSRNLTALRNSFDLEFRKFVAAGDYLRLLEKHKLANIPELTRQLPRK